MDGWIDHTPLDCCDYWSTAFQNRSADNDDDDVANSIVGFYVTTIVIMIVMMHLIQQPGLPHNYAPPSLRFTILRLLAESQATSTKRAGERTHRFLTETAKSLLSFRLTPPLYILVRGSGIERAFKDKEVGFSNSIVPLINLGICTLFPSLLPSWDKAWGGKRGI